jgi:hypothetical protein
MRWLNILNLSFNHKQYKMKKLSILFLFLFTLGMFTTSCREEKEVEVQELRDDVPNDNSNESTYDTNPTENDPD